MPFLVTGSIGFIIGGVLIFGNVARYSNGSFIEPSIIKFKLGALILSYIFGVCMLPLLHGVYKRFVGEHSLKHANANVNVMVVASNLGRH